MRIKAVGSTLSLVGKFMANHAPLLLLLVLTIPARAQARNGFAQKPALLDVIGEWLSASTEDYPSDICPTRAGVLDRVTISSKAGIERLPVLRTIRVVEVQNDSGSCTFAGAPGSHQRGATRIVQILSSPGYVHKTTKGLEMVLSQATCEGDCYYDGALPDRRKGGAYMLELLSKDGFTKVSEESGAEIHYTKVQPVRSLEYFVGSWIGTGTTTTSVVPVNSTFSCEVDLTTEDRFVVSTDPHNTSQMLVADTALKKASMTYSARQADCAFNNGGSRFYTESWTCKYDGHILKDGLGFKLYLNEGTCKEGGLCFLGCGGETHKLEGVSHDELLRIHKNPGKENDEEAFTRE